MQLSIILALIVLISSAEALLGMHFSRHHHKNAGQTSSSSDRTEKNIQTDIDYLGKNITNILKTRYHRNFKKDTNTILVGRTIIPPNRKIPSFKIKFTDKKARQQCSCLCKL